MDQRTTPLPEPLGNHLRAVLAEKGDFTIACEAGVSRNTVVRAAAGLGLYRLSIKRLEAYLSRLDMAA
jgi:hypothetical protein